MHRFTIFRLYDLSVLVTTPPFTIAKTRLYDGCKRIIKFESGRQTLSQSWLEAPNAQPIVARLSRLGQSAQRHPQHSLPPSPPSLLPQFPNVQIPYLISCHIRLPFRWDAPPNLEGISDVMLWLALCSARSQQPLHALANARVLFTTSGFSHFLNDTYW